MFKGIESNVLKPFAKVWYTYIHRKVKYLFCLYYLELILSIILVCSTFKDYTEVREIPGLENGNDGPAPQPVVPIMLLTDLGTTTTVERCASEYLKKVFKSRIIEKSLSL